MSDTNDKSASGSQRADCEECAFDETYHLRGKRDLMADRHERETGHTVDRSLDFGKLSTGTEQ